MPAIGEDNPDVAYRRGYQRGVVQVCTSLERYLDPAAREVVRAWIENDIYEWRLNGLVAEPPVWRLNMLGTQRGGPRTHQHDR
jgi:hypothetical protein